MFRVVCELNSFCRMSVLLETTVGDLVVDLELEKVPMQCANFLRLCRLKKLNNMKVSKIDKGFIAIFGEDEDAGCAEYQYTRNSSKNCLKFLGPEHHPKVKHSKMGTVGSLKGGSSFYITLKDGPIEYLDNKDNSVIGYIEDGIDVVKKINDLLCDTNNRPFNVVRIRHTILLDDEEVGLEKADWMPKEEPLSPPEVVDELFRPVEDEEDERVIQERQKEAIAAAQEVELELMGDIPSADIRPPSNVLFVCQLNPVTEDDDLKIVFGRFGAIKKCEIIRDYKTGDSLQYAFVEFETDEACNKAYVAMQNVLIDDKRIKVDFSQSVSKVWNQYRRKNTPSANKNPRDERYRSRYRSRSR